MMRWLACSLRSLLALPPRSPSRRRRSITDPPRDAAYPARMAVLHVPSGGVADQRRRVSRQRARATSDSGHLPRLAGQREEPRPGAGGAARRVERRHLQLSRLVGQPGPVPLRPEPGGCAPPCWPTSATRPTQRSWASTPRRIALAGHSMGGWVTALVAATDKAADWCGDDLDGRSSASIGATAASRPSQAVRDGGQCRDAGRRRPRR